MAILENVMNVVFPGYKRVKELQGEQENNHKLAEGISIKSVKDYQFEYKINMIYTLSVKEEGNKKEFYLTEVVNFEEEDLIISSYLQGKGHILLINEEEKKKLVVDTYFHNKREMGELNFTAVRAVDLKVTIPDFLYIIDGREYLILLEPKFKAENEDERKGQLRRLYKYLFGNIGKQIDIDINFDEAGCYENKCRLVYFRLHSDSLFLVLEHDKEIISHTFENINDIAASSTYGDEALKFWLYMGHETYRFYLYHPKETRIPIDSAIYQVSKDIMYLG
ncbi:hypothetical protein LCM14_06185 [Priestia aryabhattai]|uniref:hypothetical protein n=1 Tax=Priestia aryabhattai TaxID=412384 RepID=UPI001CD6A863|nr:hypothetical protein [Priestia aryabhattai]MCA1049380.1 hypothetical protein [Priestia aryabhattai]